MKVQKIFAEYRDHMGDDLMVVNAARGSFGKDSAWHSQCWSCGHTEGRDTWIDDPCPVCGKDNAGHYDNIESRFLKPSDASLIRYLALGYRTNEWEALIDEFIAAGKANDRQLISDMLRIYKNRPQHWAPFAHPHLQLRMTLPIFLGRQFVKHQVGGVWSEESRRYISDEPGVWFPHEWHTRPDDIKQGAAGLVSDQEFVRNIANNVVEASVGAYMSLVSPRGVLKVAPEEARILLPQNAMTTVVWTGSLAFWARVVNQRVDAHAQGAAQELGRHISAIVGKRFPESWKWLISPNLQGTAA